MGFFKRRSHGYWVEFRRTFHPDEYECSECRRAFDTMHGVCPHCGAIMDMKSMDELMEQELLYEIDQDA